MSLLPKHLTHNSKVVQHLPAANMTRNTFTAAHVFQLKELRVETSTVASDMSCGSCHCSCTRCPCASCSSEQMQNIAYTTMTHTATSEDMKT